VQTVALRLIVDREREIKAFEKKEYWTIDAHLAAGKPPAFDARFLGKGEEKIEITNGEDAEKIRLALEKADWLVRSVEKKERRRNATPPFTTSKLQQDSSRKLRFSVKRTMMIAQRLYEGIELGDEGLVGLITYMRTDSTQVSQDAIAEVREYITNTALTICRSRPIHIRRRRKRRRRTKRFVRPRRCAIPTRSSSTCTKMNSRSTS
jgi:DNA topoisomerase-1